MKAYTFIFIALFVFKTLSSSFVFGSNSPNCGPLNGIKNIFIGEPRIENSVALKNLSHRPVVLDNQVVFIGLKRGTLHIEGFYKNGKQIYSLELPEVAYHTSYQLSSGNGFLKTIWGDLVDLKTGKVKSIHPRNEFFDTLLSKNTKNFFNQDKQFVRYNYEEEAWVITDIQSLKETVFPIKKIRDTQRVFRKDSRLYYFVYPEANHLVYRDKELNKFVGLNLITGETNLIQDGPMQLQPLSSLPSLNLNLFIQDNGKRIYNPYTKNLDRVKSIDFQDRFEFIFDESKVLYEELDSLILVNFLEGTKFKFKAEDWNQLSANSKFSAPVSVGTQTVQIIDWSKKEPALYKRKRWDHPTVRTTEEYVAYDSSEKILYTYQRASLEMQELMPSLLKWHLDSNKLEVIPVPFRTADQTKPPVFVKEQNKFYFIGTEHEGALVLEGNTWQPVLNFKQEGQKIAESTLTTSNPLTSLLGEIKNLQTKKLSTVQKEKLLIKFYELLATSPNSFYSLVKEYSELLPLFKNELKTTYSKLPVSEQKKLNRAALKYLELKMDLVHELSFTQPSDWNDLAWLTPILQNLPSDEKNAAVLKISRTLTKGYMYVSDSPLFEPLIIKLISQRVKSYFNDSAKKLTDIVYVRQQNQLKPFIVGVDALNNEPHTLNKFGFAIDETLAPITLNASSADKNGIISKQQYEWNMGDEKFKGEILVKVKSNRMNEVLAPKRAPLYDDLYADGRLSGLVTTGQNFHDPDLIQEYFEYYKKSGYNFEKPVNVSNIEAWIQDGIEKGEIDYWIKEAHIDGDEKNLFRIYEDGKIFRGSKARKDGSIEVVYIFDPNPKSGTRLLSNKSFGEWISKREGASKGELIYFNTSCNSLFKACNEMEAAMSPKLTVITPSGMANSFTNEKESAIFQMLEGLREKETYQQMKARLKKNTEYKEGHTDYYLFPDDPAYQNAIRSKIEIPIEVTTKVTDSKGKVVHFDHQDAIYGVLPF